VPNSARAFHHLPLAALRAHVERIWGWHEPRALRLPIVMPGLGAELFFHHGDPFRALIRGAEQQLERGHLVCVRGAPLRVLEQPSAGFTAVRIRAGALGRFTPIPLRELRDTQVGVGEIWGLAGAELANRIAEATSSDVRVRLIEQFLLRRLAETKREPIVERALQLIYCHSDAIAVATLAQFCGLGRRQFERRIGTYFGQSAVELRCLARFYHLARRLAVDPAADTLQAALAAGYYDQAHFIREFKRFAGMTPEAFRRVLATATHFYNPVRRAPTK
jgi:AraC-like DNA-binding protein